MKKKNKTLKIENTEVKSNRPIDKGTHGGWRGGGRPALTEEERQKKRVETKLKYSKGKKMFQAPIELSDYDYLNKLKLKNGFSNNSELMKYFIGIGKREENKSE